jgi:hypothetical protein
MKRKDGVKTVANGDHRESDLGRKLRKIAKEYEARGGKLLSREEIEREVAERRGAA